MSTQTPSEPARSAEFVQTIVDAIWERANREDLWHMRLLDIDLGTMAEEIVEKVRLIDGQGEGDARVDVEVTKKASQPVSPADSVSQQAINRLAKEFSRVGSEPLDEPVPAADDMRERAADYVLVCWCGHEWPMHDEAPVPPAVCHDEGRCGCRGWFPVEVRQSDGVDDVADTWPEDEDWDPPSPLDDPPESENENDSPRQYEGAPWYCQTHQTMHHRPAHIDGQDARS